jgi:hypothetical protein
MSLISRLHQKRNEMLNDQEDPWKRVLERVLPADLVCTSTVALLDVLNFTATTGNARRASGRPRPHTTAAIPSSLA